MKTGVLASVEDALYGNDTVVSVSHMTSTSEGEVMMVTACKPGSDFTPSESFLVSDKVEEYVIKRKGDGGCYLVGNCSLTAYKHSARIFYSIEAAWSHLSSLRNQDDFTVVRRKKLDNVKKAAK